MKSARLMSLVISASLLFSSAIPCYADEIQNTNISYLTEEGTSDNTTVEDTTVNEDAWKENLGTINLGDTITCTGTGVAVDGNKVLITAGGDFTVTGTLNDGYIEINTTEKVKLRLSNANITNTSGPAICFTDAKKAFITIEEGTTNNLTDGSTYSTYFTTLDAKGALFSNDTLEIKGKGILNVNGNYKHGIVSDDDVIIENGNININSATDGIHANDNITVSGGNLYIESQSDAIESEGDIIIDKGNFNIVAADDGIHSVSTLTINDGNINVLKSYEGIESKADLIINGGNISVSATDDGLNATTGITINGGKNYITAKADGIDSNGTINITGGTTITLGGGTPECGIDCDRNVFTITGGTLIATGGDNSTPSTASTQCSIILGSGTVGSIVRLESNGQGIITFNPTKAYQNMIVSSPDIQLNNSYTVYTGGTISEAENFNGLYTGGTYSGGTQSSTITTSSVVTNSNGSSSGGWVPGGNRPGGGSWFPGGDQGGTTDGSDLNGDGVVNILDLSLIAVNYNNTQQSQNWKSNYDLNGDGVIDIFDLVSVSKKI